MAERVRFESPPVREVILAVWFDRLYTLSALHLSSLRLDWADSLPNVEEVVPLAPWAAPEPGMSFVNTDAKWPMPSCIFASENRDKEVLIQDDRFTLTWRFMGESEYPGFESLHAELTTRYREFTESITASNNPTPIAQRVTIEYENYLADVDSNKVSVSVLTGARVEPGDESFDNGVVSIRRHYCADDSNGDVMLLLGVDPAPSMDESIDQEDSSAEVGPHMHSSATFLTINGQAKIAKGQDVDNRIVQAHDAVLTLFLSLVSESMQQNWGLGGE